MPERKRPAQEYARIRVFGNVAGIGFRELDGGRKLCRIDIRTTGIKVRRKAGIFITVFRTNDDRSMPYLIDPANKALK